MKLVAIPRIAWSVLLFVAVVLGLTIVGVSGAATRSGAATGAPQKTVTASLIKRPARTLAPGSTVRPSAVGQRVFTNASDGFALVGIGQAQYPAATTNGGKTWKTDGPALHINAAQAPLSVVALGASSRNTVYAFGSGQVIDTTNNGGKQWYQALFQGTTMAVVRGPSGHLVAFVDAQTGSSSKTGVTYQYVSKNGGRTWSYDNSVGGF